MENRSVRRRDLGFITNHSYLDNPTFRGMRQSLMQSPGEIYLLDLHSSSLKKERCPDGSKDKRMSLIFQQGVTIALFIQKQKGKSRCTDACNSAQMNIFAGKKAEEKPEKHKCTVYHSEIWGIREDKYNWLNKHDITKTKWKKDKAEVEFYLFIPRDEGLLKQKRHIPKITDIFPVNSVRIVTSRDSFAINTDREALRRRIRHNLEIRNLPDDIVRQTFLLKDTSQLNWVRQGKK